MKSETIDKAMYINLFKKSESPQVIFDKNKIILDVSDAFFSDFSWNEKDCIGSSLSTFIFYSDRSLLSGNLTQDKFLRVLVNDSRQYLRCRLSFTQLGGGVYSVKISKLRNYSGMQVTGGILQDSSGIEEARQRYKQSADKLKRLYENSSKINDRYLKVFENSRNYLFSIDVYSGELIEANSATAATLGFESRKECIENFQSISGHSRKNVKTFIELRKKLIDFSRLYDEVFSIENAHGKELVIKADLFMEDERRAAGFAVDYRQESETKKRLKEAETFSKMILDIFPGAFWFYSTENRAVIYVSQGAKGLFGETAYDLYMNIDTLNRIVIQDERNFSAKLKECLAGVYRFEKERFKINGKDGEKWISLISFEAVQTDYPQKGICFFAVDISNKVETEENLKKEREKSIEKEMRRLRSLLKSVQNGVMAVSRDTFTIKYWGSMSSKIFGYCEGEVLDKSVSCCFPESFAGFLRNFKETEKLKKSVFSFKSKYEKKISCTVLVYNYSDLKSDDLIVVFIDISKEMRMKDKLVKTQKMRKQLAAELIDSQEKERYRIARELHDNFAQILCVLNMRISRRLQSDIPYRKEAEQDVVLIETMIDELSNLAANLRPAAIETGGIIQSTRTFLKSIPIECSVELRADDKLIEAAIPSDKLIHIFRIIQEAVQNAIKHSNAEKITVSFGMSDDACPIINICDNGNGFDKGTVKKDGMGLFNMKERAELVGAKFAINSTPAQGTCIKLKLISEEEGGGII